jgi:hypothetical protein
MAKIMFNAVKEEQQIVLLVRSFCSGSEESHGDKINTVPAFHHQAILAAGKERHGLTTGYIHPALMRSHVCSR